MTGVCENSVTVFTYVIDVDTPRTPEVGAHSPSWPNRLIIIIILINEH